MTVSIEQTIPYLCFLFGAIPLAWCGINISQPRALRYGVWRWSQIVFKAESAEDFRERIEFELTEKLYKSAERQLLSLKAKSSDLFSEISFLLVLTESLTEEIEQIDERQESQKLDRDERLRLNAKTNKLAKLNSELSTLHSRKIAIDEQVAECSSNIATLANKRDLQTVDIFSLKKIARHRRLFEPTRLDFASRTIQRMELRVIAHEMYAFGVCGKAELQKEHFRAALSILNLSTSRLNFDELTELFDASEVVLENLSYKLSGAKIFQKRMSTFIEVKELNLDKVTDLLDLIEIDDDTEARDIYNSVDALIDDARGSRMLYLLNEDFASSLSDMIYQLMLKQREIAIRIVELKNKVVLEQAQVVD